MEQICLSGDAEGPTTAAVVAEAVESLIKICEEIDGLSGHQRHADLVTFARSGWHSAAIMLECGTPGRIAREAWKALKRDSDADTPGRRWEYAFHSRARESIVRLLGAEDMPVYATLPFKTLDTENGPRIGAAIGWPDPLRNGHDHYAYLDIEDVLLWDPRHNTVTVDGERGSSRLFTPSEDNRDGPLTVYRDPFAFFRDWVALRVERLALHQSGWRAALTVDGCMPGALAVGDLERMPWQCLHVPQLVAGPGLNRDDLRRAVFRTHRLPSIGEVGDHER